MTALFRVGRSSSLYPFHLDRVAGNLELENLCGRLDLDLLMSCLGRRVADKWLLRLLGRYLRAGAWAALSSR